MAASAGVLLAVLCAAVCGRLAWKKRAARTGRGPRAAGALCLALSALFFYAWYAQYLKWDFNELGRHYDPVDQVIYTDAGFVWVLPAGVLLIAGLLCLWRAGRR